MLCFGCGSDLSGRPTDRRRLASPSSTKVVLQWKQLVLQDNGYCESELDHLITGDGTPEQSGKMCRKCFAAYERLADLTTTLRNNLYKFLDDASTPAPSLAAPAKRARYSVSQPGTSSGDNNTTKHSPAVVTQVGYKRVKTYKLTPSRKHLGKAVARGSRTKIATECLQDPKTRDCVIKRIGHEMRKEMKVMCSDATASILRSDEKEHLSSFAWDVMNKELSTHAPTFSAILKECTKTRLKRDNGEAVVGVCAGILLKHRLNKMSLIQKIISIILFHGCASKAVYRRLSVMNLCMSHSSVLRLVEKVGTGHDSIVEKWRDTLESELKIPETIQSQPQGRLYLSNALSDDAISESDSDTSSASISSYSSEVSIEAPPISPLSSSTSESSDSDEDEDSTTTDAHTRLTAEVGTEEKRANSSEPKTYRFNGDNMDFVEVSRYQRSDSGNKSQHFFQYYAVKDRIDFSHLSDTPPDISALTKRDLCESMLPSQSDFAETSQNISFLVARVLCENVPYFKLTYDEVLTRHIKHRYYKEMSTKSKVVPLGILLKNETKGEDMVDIVHEVHRYVPTKEYTAVRTIESTGEEVPVESAVFHRVLFGGDQLTVARIRSAQKHMCNADTPIKRLEGCDAMVEDWHTKVTVLEVIWKYFYSMKSGSEHGTLYQLRNAINRTNVKSKPKADFNSCHDFFELVVHCHIIAAALKHLKMVTIEDVPSADVIADPDMAWMLPHDERKKQLYALCEAIVAEYVDLNYDKPIETVGSDSKSTGSSGGSDAIVQYASQILSLGCLYLEFCDAIKEGDGDRVLRCWRYLLPIFKGSGRKNYSIEALTLLCQHRYYLSPQLSSQLLWSRTVNTLGLPGRNIPGDLYVEHLNRVAKECIAHLGAGKTPTAIKRVGRAIGTIAPVLEQFDTTNAVVKPSGAHRGRSQDKDRNVLLKFLLQRDVFTCIPMRAHPSFPKPRNVLNSVHKNDLISWMSEKLL